MRESVEGALDWREQFRSHPLAWLVGALAVGYVLGNSTAAALKGGDDDHLLSQLATLADRLADELSVHGMKLLGPVLGGAVVFPVLADKLGELSGLNLSGLLSQLTEDCGKAGASAKGKKKRSGGKKQGKNGKKVRRAKLAATA